MSKLRMSVLLVVMAAVASLLGSTGIAAAAITIDAASPVVTFTGGAFPYTWSYAVDLNSGEEIAGTSTSTPPAPCRTTGTSGAHGCEFLTLYDVRGLSPLSVTWTDATGGLVTGTPGVQLVGPNAIGISVPDSAAIPNTYVEFACGTSLCPLASRSSALLVTLPFNASVGIGTTSSYPAHASDL